MTSVQIETSEKMESQLLPHSSACEINKDYFQWVTVKKKKNFSIIPVSKEYVSVYLSPEPHLSGISIHMNRMPKSDKHSLLLDSHISCKYFYLKNAAMKCY